MVTDILEILDNGVDIEIEFEETHRRNLHYSRLPTQNQEITLGS